MNSVLRVVITSVFTGFLAVLIFIACNDEYYLGKSREELYREMFEVDSLMKTIQLQIDSTSMELSSFYLNAQRINNGHE
tara:strand:+ start:219 stop:455 length:237 start_codon:yes stop_codon:yes gene_type:complete